MNDDSINLKNEQCRFFYYINFTTKSHPLKFN